MRVGIGTAVALALCMARAGAQTQPQMAGGAAGMKPPTVAQAEKMAPKQDPSLAPLEKTMNAAHAKLAKKPKDAKLKAAYVQATYTYAHAVMVDRGKLPSAIQYRAALGLYRRALAVDPHHEPSLNDKNMIEAIYKQMGRPIPQ